MTAYMEHESYIAAVVAALEAAGFKIDDWFAQVDEWREGAIWLSAEDGRDGLCWSENKGWLWGPETSAGSYVLEYVTWLDEDGLVPRPETIAGWWASACRGEDVGSIGARPACMRAMDGYDDDPEVMAALAAYAPAKSTVTPS